MFPELYAQHGLELAGDVPEGEVAMTTKKPVRSPEDLNEQKFRVMTNPLLVEAIAPFGACRRRCRGARSMARCRPT
jgi:TRAP-type transport system periplasmic protein